MKTINRDSQLSIAVTLRGSGSHSPARRARRLWGTLLGAVSLATVALAEAAAAADTTAPQLGCTLLVADANGAATAVVNYTIPVTDDTAPAPAAVCVPPSGTAFPVGSTTVHCTATDAAGNVGQCDFIVAVAKSTFTTVDTLPPQGGQYVSPQDFHVALASGILITNVSHNSFISNSNPPAGAAFQAAAGTTESFSSTVECDLSLNGGLTFNHISAPAQVKVHLDEVLPSPNPPTREYNTEMLQLDLQGGNLPPGFMLRESPTKVSLGRTSVRPLAGGGFAILSFFDIWTEISTDGGVTWQPAPVAAPMTLQADPPEVTFSNPNLPPVEGQYVSPQQFHTLAAQGIVLTDPSHDEFSQSEPPPPLDGTQVHTFNSRVRFHLNGSPVSAPALCTVQVHHTSDDAGGKQYYDTEMLSLDISGGGLPGGAMIRESPTKQSLGKTTIRPLGPMGPYAIGSFFDIFIEVSMDSGVTWSPAADPLHMQAALADITPPVLTCSPALTVTASGPAGAMVTYTVTATDDTDPSPSIVCNPPSGSTFPVGTTTVTCIASDASGNSSNCAFDVTVNPPVGDPCSEPDNGTGTVTLPPPGCEYLSPDQVHMIIDGLPPGTTIELAVIHKNFLCHDPGAIGPCPNDCFSTDPDCDPSNGATEQFNSTLQLHLHGTGALAGWDRDITIPNVSCQSQVGPRALGTSPQSFDTDMQAIQGQLPPGDPDFDLLRITAGSGFGLPSPGHTTLTVQGATPPGPGAIWAVDSFFDITYRIDFVGNPGGHVGGMSGSTTGTIRMVAVESLSISCPAAITVPATGPAGAMVDYPSPTISGGCAPLSVVCDPPSGNPFPVGATAVTCTASDGCGRTATCTFTVMVVIAPPVIITSPASQTVECGGLTELSVVATGVEPLSYQWRRGGMPLSDVAGEVSGSTTPTLRINHTRSSEAGSYDVVVSNAGGSTTSSAADLTVGADTHPPSITCPSDIATTASSVNGVVVTFTIPDVTDACDPAPTSQCNPPSGSVFPLGTTTVTCTARDAAMQESSCQFHIRVTTDLTLQKMVDDTPANGTLTVPARDYDCVTITKNIRMIADGVVVVHGCSPAITVSAGSVIASGFIFVTATPDPTVLVNGTGALNLRSCVVEESTHATGQPAIRVLNTGSMDLGTPGDPGLNTININGVGSLIDNSAPSSLPALGNTWQNNGAPVTDGFALEDRIYHALDALFVGLVRYQAGNVYVTVNSSSIQRGIDAASTGDIVNIQSGSYTVDSANATAPGKDITLAPGASPGLVVLNGNLTLDAGDTIAFELNGPTPGTDYDQLVVNGTVTLGGATLSATAGFGYLDCATLTLIDNNAGDAVSGTFAGLANGSIVNVSGQDFRIFYDRGSGNDVVLIKDTVAPAITGCLADFSVGTDAGACSAVVNYPVPLALDNCDGVVAVVCIPASGSAFPVGTTPVVCTSTDSVGNSSTCPFSVIVIDTEPPAIVCPANITRGNDPNQCSAVVTFTTTATDNCSATVACVPANGSTFPLGTTTVNCTATDATGLTATCSFTVTVNDTQSPVANCPANITVSSDPNSCSAVVNYTATASDNCDSALRVRIYSGFTGSGGGAPYSGLVGTLAASSISFATDTGYNWHPFGLFEFGADITGTLAVAAADTYTFILDSDDGSLLFIDGSLFVDNGNPHGPGIVTGSVTLTAGTHTFEVQFFECCGGESGVDLTLPAGVTYGTGSATIACVPPSGSTFPPGTTPVNCTAEDAAGNTAPCSFTVTVNDTQPPVIACPTPITVPNDAGQCSAVVNYTATAVDNCDSSVLARIYSGHGTTGGGAPYSDLVGTFNASGISFGTDTGFNWHPFSLSAFGADISGTLVVAADGTYPFTLNSDDGSLLFIDGSLVVDDGNLHPPTVNNGNVFLTAGNHSFEVQFFEDLGGESGVDLTLPPGVTYGTPVVCSPPSGSTFPVGTTPVNCTATDSAGNSSTCPFSVTVADTQPPMFCPPPTAGLVHWWRGEGNFQDSVGSLHGTPSGTASITASGKVGQGFDFGPGLGVVTLGGASLPPPWTASMWVNRRDTIGLSAALLDDGVTALKLQQFGSLLYVGYTRYDSVDYTFNFSAPVGEWVNITYVGTANDVSLYVCGTLIGTIADPIDLPLFQIGNRTAATDDQLNSQLDEIAVYDRLLDPVEIAGLCCPPNIVANNDPGQCSATVSYSTPPVSDNCIVSINCVPASGGAFPVGVTTVTCTATDTSASTTTSFTVTVNDTEPPVATCPANITVGNDPNQCGAVVNFNATATDNCPGATILCSPASGSTFPLGTTAVNCTATDAVGNTAPCSFTVTVNDTQPPAIACPLPITVPNGPGQCSAVANYIATATDNCSSSVLVRIYSGHGTIGGGAPYSGLVETFSASGISFGTDTGYNWHPSGLSDFGADITGTLVVAADGIYTFTLGSDDGSLLFIDGSLVVDDGGEHPPTAQSGNVALTAGNHSFEVQFFEDFLGESGVDLTLPSGVTYGTPVACSPPSGSTFLVGTTPVNCTATDVAGNTGTCAFLVTVLDVEPPVIVSCSPAAILPADENCLASVPDFTSGVIATDCSAFAVTQSPLAGTPVGLGPHSIMLTVTDAASLSAACATTFTVIDTTPPVIVSCAPPQSADANAACQAAVPDFSGGVVATDCNGPVTVTQSPTAGTLVGAGATTVTLTVEDAANNQATCTTTFTVRAAADLSIQVVSSPEPVTVGQPVSYTVTVANLGPCPASGVTVNNVLSAGQVLVSVTDPGTAIARACLTPDSSAWYRAEGNASDSVGVNNGTINGGVTFGPEAVGQGFIFDGLTGYISAPDAPALRPASLTIEGWIKIGDPNGLHVVLAKPQGGGLADSYSIWFASGVLNAAVSDGSGSGQFLTYPNFPSSSIFVSSDIINLPSLASKLKNPAPADFVSQYLNSQLSADTLALLAAYAGGPDAPLQGHIVGDFNRIIQSGPLYTPARFLGVTLSDETSYMLNRNPTGIDLVRLNRMLIRDTYPAEIATVLFPQLTQRYHIAYTFDTVTKAQALYVNGELVDSSIVNKTISYAGRPLVIGAGENAGIPDFFYQGELDELALYNRALSGIEVQAIHSAGANGKCFNSGAVIVGSLAGGASQTFTVVAVPTTCPSASLQATVSGAETDPDLANNSATATATVAELPADQLRLSIRRVSPNNDHVEVSWPITCAPYILETTGELSPSPGIPWTSAPVPVLILQGRYSTVVPASDVHRFFRLKSQ